MRLPPGGGDGVDALAKGARCGLVARACGLCVVVVCSQEFLLELVERGVGLFDKGKPAVSAGLGQDLLGDGNQAGVAGVANGPATELGVVGDGPEEDVAAGNVADAVGMVDADAAAEEEVDDALLEDVGGRRAMTTVRIDSAVVVRGRGGWLIFLGLVLRGLGLFLVLVSAAFLVAIPPVLRLSVVGILFLIRLLLALMDPADRLEYSQSVMSGQDEEVPWSHTPAHGLVQSQLFLVVAVLLLRRLGWRR